MLWEVAEEGTRVCGVGVELGAEDAVFAVRAEVELGGEHHAEDGRKEVEPERGKDLREDSGAYRAGRVDAESGDRREKDYVEHDEDSDAVAGVGGDAWAVGRPEYDAHEEGGHEELGEEGGGGAVDAGNGDGVVDKGVGELAAEEQGGDGDTEDASEELEGDVEEGVLGADLPRRK